MWNMCFESTVFTGKVHAFEGIASYVSEKCFCCVKLQLAGMLSCKFCG